MTLTRRVTTDSNGYKRAELVRPGDPPGQGLPSMPPSLDELPWEDIKRDIHNILVEQGVINWADWQSMRTPMIALNPLRRALIALYKGELSGGNIP